MSDFAGVMPASQQSLIETPDTEKSTDLETEIDALKKRLEALEKKNKGTEAGAKSDSGGKDSGAKSEKKWNVKLGGHIQMDYVTWANADESIPIPRTTLISDD